MSAPITYRADKCPCGQAGCSSGNLTPVTYGQGVMQMAEAEDLARKLNAYPKLIAALKQPCPHSCTDGNCPYDRRQRALLAELGEAP